MDSPIQTPLYDTLTLTPPSSAAATPNRSSKSDFFEPYTVFRNEISLYDSNAAEASSAPALDFLSLDVDGSDAAHDEDPDPKTPVVTIMNDEPLKALPEPRMENGWFKGYSKFRSPMMQLHKEIVDFCDFLSPTPDEQASRSMAVKCVFGVINYIWPNCKVEVFGSFKTGLYLPTSDIDVVILSSGIKNPQTGLQALGRALSQKGIAKKIQVIAKARVPIVKFVEKRSGVSFDISFDVDNGPKAAEFIKDAISRWPPLRPLCLILKVFLQQRELNEVYTGGIGSYALLVMLMSMLQNLRERQAALEHNLGVLLIQFFDFYGRKLNTTDVGVSCNGAGNFFSKHGKGFMNKGRPFLLAIEDPQAPENDIGKNSFKYFQIKSAFAMAFLTLTNPKIILSFGPKKSILSSIIRPDPVLLERKGGCNGGLGFDSILPGAREPLPLHCSDHEILGNWQFDDEEEALPRGDGSEQSPGKKRKVSSNEKSGKKKLKENGSTRERERKKKQRQGYNRDYTTGFSHQVGRPTWSH